MRKIEGLKIRNIAGDNLIVRKSRDVVDMTKVIRFNETAVFLWEALESKEFGIEDVSALLIKNFGIEYNKATEDARIWLDSMIKAGLIEM